MIVGLALGVVAVAFSAILARVALREASPVAVSFWRTLGGAVALAPFAWRTARRSGVRISPTRRRQLAASGAFLALHFCLFIGSLALTTVASAVTLTTASPIFVALGAWWLLGERSTPRTLVGMGVAVAGAVAIGAADLIGTGSAGLGGRAVLGDVMAFSAAIAVTGYLLIGRVARRDVASTVYSATVFAWAAGVLLLVCGVVGIPLMGYSAVTWAAILGIIIGPQLLGHSVFNMLLSSVSPMVLATVVLAEPVVATLLAMFFFVELPAPLFWIGAPLVLLGVAIAASRTVRNSPPVEVMPPA